MIPSTTDYPTISAACPGIWSSPFNSSEILPIATELSRYDDPIPLLKFLSQQDVKEFKNPELQKILVSSFHKAHTPAFPLGPEIFWDLAKRIVYSFCQNPDHLEKLIEGGSIEGTVYASLFSIHDPGMLFALFQDILPLVQTLAPGRSADIISRAKEKCKLNIFSQAPSPNAELILERGSPPPIGLLQSPPLELK